MPCLTTTAGTHQSIKILDRIMLMYADFRTHHILLWNVFLTDKFGQGKEMHIPLWWICHRNLQAFLGSGGPLLSQNLEWKIVVKPPLFMRDWQNRHCKPAL